MLGGAISLCGALVYADVEAGVRDAWISPVICCLTTALRQEAEQTASPSSSSRN